MSIYYALFSSHLTYGCQICGQGGNQNSTKLQSLQTRAIRKITFTSVDTDTNLLYKNNNILILSDYIKLQNCIFLYKFSNELLPSNFINYFSNKHSHATRGAQKNLFNKPIVSTNKFGILSIKYQTILNWNHLQSTLNIDLLKLTLPKLKSFLIKHFISSYK